MSECSYYDKTCIPCGDKPCNPIYNCERIRRLNIQLQKENYTYRVNPIIIDSTRLEKKTY